MTALAQADLHQAARYPSESWEDYDLLNARVLYGFDDLCLACGGDPKAMLAMAGIGLNAGNVAARPITYSQFMRLLSGAANRLKCPDFGMRLALGQAGTELYGPLGTIMKNSRTFGDALNYATRHSSVHSGAVRISKLVSPLTNEVAFSHEILVGSFEDQVQAMEYVMLAGHLGAKVLTNGRVSERHAMFRHRAVSAPSVYRRYFRCDILFHQHMDGLIFYKDDLATPIIDADPKQQAELIETVRSRFADKVLPLHSQVRGMVLRMMLSGGATNELVAAELGMHTRTLHRRLAEAGTSFQKVKDEVRCELARYYLAQKNVSLMWITDKLGFAEQAVFTRFCQRNFGSAPRELRR